MKIVDKMFILSFSKFLVLSLMIYSAYNFLYRIKLYNQLSKLMKKYSVEFDLLGADKFLLYIPEFCNFRKVKEKLDMSNNEIADLIKKLTISKYTLFPTLILPVLIGFILSKILDFLFA